MKQRKFRLECLAQDLPNDRDLEVSLFGSEGPRESGIRKPYQTDFVDVNGESHRTLGRKSGKDAFYVNPEDLTQEERLKAMKGTFVWGKVIAIHTVGEYQIVEYVDKHHEDGENGISFHGAIDWADAHVSFNSLDEALVGLVARKYEGDNSCAGEYFFRMLDREEE